MPELNHTCGGDLVLGPTGDLALVSDTLESQQRVIRRLLTNAGDYIWQLSYGAGLPSRVGEPVDTLALQNIVLSQIFLEPTVSRVPAPVITTAQLNGNTVVQSISYTNATTGLLETLTF
jgi:phage baseplate assembly protein W